MLLIGAPIISFAHLKEEKETLKFDAQGTIVIIFTLEWFLFCSLPALQSFLFAHLNEQEKNNCGQKSF